MLLSHVVRDSCAASAVGSDKHDVELEVVFHNGRQFDLEVLADDFLERGFELAALGR